MMIARKRNGTHQKKSPPWMFLVPIPEEKITPQYWGALPLWKTRQKYITNVCESKHLKNAKTFQNLAAVEATPSATPSSGVFTKRLKASPFAVPAADQPRKATSGSDWVQKMEPDTMITMPHHLFTNHKVLQMFPVPSKFGMIVLLVPPWPASKFRKYHGMFNPSEHHFFSAESPQLSKHWTWMKNDEHPLPQSMTLL